MDKKIHTLHTTVFQAYSISTDRITHEVIRMAKHGLWDIPHTSWMPKSLKCNPIINKVKKKIQSKLYLEDTPCTLEGIDKADFTGHHLTTAQIMHHNVDGSLNSDIFIEANERDT